MLVRTAPQRRFSVAEVATQLYVPESTAAELLDGLCAAGVLDRTDDGRHYRYAPRGEPLHSIVDELAECYAADLVGITTLIHGRCMHRR